MENEYSNRCTTHLSLGTVNPKSSSQTPRKRLLLTIAPCYNTRDRENQGQ